MIKYITPILVLFFCVQLNAQKLKPLNSNTFRKARTSFKEDKKSRVLVSLNHENVFHKETNGFATQWYSRGIAIAFQGDLKIKQSNFSLSVGLGYSFVAYYHNAQMSETNQGVSFPNTYSLKSANSELKRSRLGIHYLDLPFEIRYRSAESDKKKSFKMALGLKWSTKLLTSTKEIKRITDSKVSVSSIFNHRDVSQYRLGPTFRIGYGILNINAFYNAINLFKKDRGPEMQPFSIGLTFSLF